MTAKVFNLIYILISLLLVSHYFSYSFWSETRGPQIIQIYSIFTILYVFFKYNAVRRNYDSNYRIIFLLIISCIFTLFFCLLFNFITFDNQRDFVLILAMLPVFFFLKVRKVSKKEVLAACTVFLLSTLALQIYQQINFSDPIFGLRDVNEYGEMVFNGDQRNNLFRYNIGIATLGEFCLCYYWSKVCEKFSMKYAFFFILSSISIYMYLTRQFIFASLTTVFFSLFFIKDKNVKRWSFLGILVFAIILYINYNLFFKDMIEYTESETYSTDIRQASYSFIFAKVFDNPILCFFGHGHTMDEISWMSKGIYCSDIGFVGQMYLQGVLWVVIYFYTVYEFLWKRRDSTPLYLKLFFFCTLLHSPMIFPYSRLSTTFVWIIILYLCSLENNNFNVIVPNHARKY